MRMLFLALLVASPLCFARTIVVVQSYHIEYKWDATYVNALQTVLGKDHKLHVFELDTKRLPKPDWPQRVSEIQAAIADIKPDLAILGDDNAFTLMADHFVEQDIPVVFLGVNGGPVQHPTLEHPLVTGILERPFFKESVRHLRKVLQERERFLILMDDSPTMRNAVNEYFGDKRQATIHGSQVDILLTNDRDTWLQSAVNAHERYDAVLLGTYHTIRDNDNQYVAPDDLLKQAFDQAQIPLFAFWDFSVGKELAIGGFTISAHQEGLTAARMASLILSGIKPDRISRLQSLSGHYVYSRSGLWHWDLELSPMITSQANFVE